MTAKKATGTATGRTSSTEATKAQVPKAAAPAPKEIKLSIASDAASAVVAKFIGSIGTRGAKLDTDIHSAAMACLHHAEKHGDVTLMQRLLLAMPKSARRNALAQWAIAFGKFAPNEDRKTVDTAPVIFNKAGKTDMAAAMAKPFWDFKNVREGTADWVFSNYIEGVIKTLTKHAEGGGVEAVKAKAALAAMQGVTNALAVPSLPALPAGVEAERRVVLPVVTAAQPAVH